MRILFLGNHTVGVRVLEILRAHDEVIGVVAHPPDPEDGVRYESVYDFSRAHGIAAIRGKARSEAVARFVEERGADILWVTDYRYILPLSILRSCSVAAINLHPSLLPAYRGRAPVNWAILRGETEIGLTAHHIGAGMDDGDIIVQRRFSLSDTEDVGDALEKLYPLYADVTREVLGALRSGSAPRYAQDHARASVFPARQPADGLINWMHSARDIRNLIRAVARPYPGAFTLFSDERVTIWRAAVTDNEVAPSAETPAGAVAELDAGRLVIQCGTGRLRIDEFESCRPVELRPGDQLQRS